jgi:hypothetical protein
VQASRCNSLFGQARSGKEEKQVMDFLPTNALAWWANTGSSNNQDMLDPMGIGYIPDYSAPIALGRGFNPNSAPIGNTAPTVADESNNYSQNIALGRGFNPNELPHPLQTSNMQAAAFPSQGYGQTNQAPRNFLLNNYSQFNPATSPQAGQYGYAQNNPVQRSTSYYGNSGAYAPDERTKVSRFTPNYGFNMNYRF